MAESKKQKREYSSFGVEEEDQSLPQPETNMTVEDVYIALRDAGKWGKVCTILLNEESCATDIPLKKINWTLTMSHVALHRSMKRLEIIRHSQTDYNHDMLSKAWGAGTTLHRYFSQWEKERREEVSVECDCDGECYCYCDIIHKEAQQQAPAIQQIAISEIAADVNYKQKILQWAQEELSQKEKQLIQDKVWLCEEEKRLLEEEQRLHALKANLNQNQLLTSHQ
ncbi:hypothetical protein KI387_006699, partial [Taxus chinensis]